MRAPFCFILLHFTSFHFFTCIEDGLEKHHRHHHHHHHRDGTITIKPKKKTQKRRHHRNKNKIPNNDIDKNKEEIGKAQKKRNENLYIFDEFDTLADRYVHVYFV